MTSRIRLFWPRRSMDRVWPPCGISRRTLRRCSPPFTKRTRTSYTSRALPRTLSLTGRTYWRQLQHESGRHPRDHLRASSPIATIARHLLAPASAAAAHRLPMRRGKSAASFQKYLPLQFLRSVHAGRASVPCLAPISSEVRHKKNAAEPSTCCGLGFSLFCSCLRAPWESLQYYPLRDFWRDGKQMISA